MPDTQKAYKVLNALIKLGFKLMFLPVVAGISYEILKLLAKSDCLIVRILRSPGMLLQKLTTKEPTDDMLEVSIAAFKTVQAMDADSSIAERRFDISIPYPIARQKLKELAPVLDDADLDWIFVEATNKKRSELEQTAGVKKAEYDIAENIARNMTDGKPLQYALGYTEFYGVRLSMNPSVLIPRPETEELAQKAIEYISARQNARVLDLCTGSGAIAIAVAKNTDAEVVASDISAAAIEVAKANALNNEVKIDFEVGDMFEATDGTFDAIISNPPYIPTDDIENLDARVKNFEPRLALDGGKDGLRYYRLIRDGFEARLKDDGVLFLELGIDEADSITEIFEGFDVEIFNDLEGVRRIALIKRK